MGNEMVVGKDLALVPRTTIIVVIIIIIKLYSSLQPAEMFDGVLVYLCMQGLEVRSGSIPFSLTRTPGVLGLIRLQIPPCSWARARIIKVKDLK